MAPRPQHRRILVLGASGKLGRALRAAWHLTPPEGVDFTWISRNPGPPGTLVWRPGEGFDALPAAQAVLALWGVTGGTPPELAANAALARVAQTVGAAVGAKQVLHCSSAAVYGRAAGRLHETAACEPANPYGAAKLAMEEAILGAGCRMTQTILRIGNVAGADMLFANMRPGEDVTLDRFETGQGPVRSYVAPSDLGRAILALVTAGAGGVLNIAAPGPTAMEDIAAAAGCGVRWRDAPETALARVDLDTTRLGSFCTLPDDAGDPVHLVRQARLSGLWP